jgi:hypothetical protein
LEVRRRKLEDGGWKMVDWLYMDEVFPVLHLDTCVLILVSI